MVQQLFWWNAFFCVLITQFILTEAQENIFTFSPDQPYCIGEEVVLTCYVYPTAGDYSNFAFLSFNDSDPQTITIISANTATTGYTATGSIPAMGNSARIELTIISFKLSDNNTLFGCYAEFSDNATVTGLLESGYPRIADPVSGFEGTHTITILSNCSIQTVFNVTSIVSNRLTGLTYTFDLSNDNTDTVLETITLVTDSMNHNATFSVTFDVDVCYKLSVSVKNCANAGNGPTTQPVFFSLQGVRDTTGEFIPRPTNISRVEWRYSTDESCPNNYTGDFLTEDLFSFSLIDITVPVTNNSIYEIGYFNLYLPERFDFYIPEAYDLSTNKYALRIQLCEQNLTDQDIPILIVTVEPNTVLIILIVLMVLLIILLITIVVIITLFLVLYFYRKRQNDK